MQSSFVCMSVAPCNCKDRLISLACKDMEMKGESLPLPCQSALGN